MAMAAGEDDDVEEEAETNTSTLAAAFSSGGGGGKGQWFHAAFHLATTVATPAAYAPLPFAIASLGWPAGCTMLITGTLVTWYSNLLVASLWAWDGVPHPTYRHLVRSIFGMPGYYATIFFQQLASIGNNITIQIAAAISMKVIYKVYHEDDDRMTLQHFIILLGVMELGLSQLPTIHSLRWVNSICTLCTIGFAATAISLSIYTGVRIDESEDVDYKLHGSLSSKVFGVLSALGTIAFSFGDAMLPEIQHTLKEPRRRNMYKGISGAYIIIIVTYWTLAFVGYWTFGSSVNPYLLTSFTRPNWTVILANIFAIIQIIGCYQIYCRPTYGFIETKFINPKKGLFSPQNIVNRLIITSVYIFFITLISCAFPFFGDFVALCGAFGFTPLDFIIPSLAYLAVRRPKSMSVWILNMCIVIVYTSIAIAGSIGAIRFIAVDVKSYKLFNNM